MPKFRTVSIIPGIEVRAPERTLNNNGFSPPPNFISIKVSKRRMPVSIFFHRGSEISSVCRYSIQTSVLIVKPGGTGIPKFDISAKLAPFPPNK